MYTHVAHYVDNHGASMTVPFDEKTLDIIQILDDAKLETLSFEKLDGVEIFEKFLNWMNSATSEPWSIMDMDAKDVNNWMRYQDVAYYERNIVLEMLKDWQSEG